MAEPHACSSERVIQDVSPRNPAGGSMAHQWSALSVKWLSHVSYICSPSFCCLITWHALGPAGLSSLMPLFPITKKKLHWTSASWGPRTMGFGQPMVWAPPGQVPIPHPLNTGKRWAGLHGIIYRPAVAIGRRYPLGYELTEILIIPLSKNEHCIQHLSCMKYILDYWCWAMSFLLHIALVNWIIMQLAIGYILLLWSKSLHFGMLLCHSSTFRKMIQLVVTLEV